MRRILYGLSAVAILLVGGSFLLPAQAVVSRSAEVAAPPEAVFAIVGDLRRFNEIWAMADLDPEVRYSYQGTESGLGQKLAWASDNLEIGSGVTTIVDYQPPQRVEFRTVAGRERALTEFVLEPIATGTRVTWTYTTPLAGVPDRWAGLLYDSRIGPEFEKGLANLKSLAERASPTP
ncbi:MAG: SRPBCC family protein [Rhizobiaceae bacterium]|nr:SRPBCC family protein [Rhizobiaceae bacterium]